MTTGAGAILSVYQVFFFQIKKTVLIYYLTCLGEKGTVDFA